ncbi:MAG: dihydrofolate reductase [Paludibacteraceae bacterium]|nr:dihydrofolate reductase [Paludibacteraceae bacterium]
MAKVCLIAAVDEQLGIGYRNRLLCHLPADMRHFKSLTVGHTVIMGRKTFESLPKGALPDRRNIVLTRNSEAQFAGCETAVSLSAALAMCGADEEVFVIGGASVYAEAMSEADRLEITHIQSKFTADAWFPDINGDVWKAVSAELFDPDEKNRYAYCFVSYRRR